MEAAGILGLVLLGRSWGHFSIVFTIFRYVVIDASLKCPIIASPNAVNHTSFQMRTVVSRTVQLAAKRIKGRHMHRHAFRPYLPRSRASNDQATFLQRPHFRHPGLQLAASRRLPCHSAPRLVPDHPALPLRAYRSLAAAKPWPQTVSGSSQGLAGWRLNLAYRHA